MLLHLVITLLVLRYVMDLVTLLRTALILVLQQVILLVLRYVMDLVTYLVTLFVLQHKCNGLLIIVR